MAYTPIQTENTLEQVKLSYTTKQVFDVLNNNAAEEDTRADRADAKFEAIEDALKQKQPLDADLTAIAALQGTSGLLRKTAADTWEFDTTGYTTNVGTVTSVAAGTGLTLSGTATVNPTLSFDENNYKLLSWADYALLATKQFVLDEIEDLPEPMIFKGTVGTGGTITALPTASAQNEGFVYKVITGGTYAGQTAKVGDTYICAKTGTSTYSWVLVPSGDDVEDTWRQINVNGTQLLGNGISTGVVNFKNGGNITVTGSGNDITLGVESGYSIPSTTDQSTWSGKQDALSAQTAYTAKGTSTKVPTITTNALGQVTAISETDIAFPVTSVNGDTGAITNVAKTNVDNVFSTQTIGGDLKISVGQGLSTVILHYDASDDVIDVGSTSKETILRSNSQTISVNDIASKTYADSIKAVTKTFTANDARWSSTATNGVYTLTINDSDIAGRHPFACYNSDNEQVMVTLGFTTTTIYIKSDTKFAGSLCAM